MKAQQIKNLEELKTFLKGRVYKLAFTKYGSKFLQKKASSECPSFTEYLLQQTREISSQMMMDDYGNYLYSSLISNTSIDQRIEILENLKDDFIEVCKNKKGTHVVQKLISACITEEEQKFFEKVFEFNLIILATNKEGHHVVKALLIYLIEKDWILKLIHEKFKELAADQNGLSVVK